MEMYLLVNKRAAVVLFLVAWFALPTFALLLTQLSPPWFQVGCAAVLAFIGAWIWAMVRAIRSR